jgi:Mn2+/Fe2+ NRAMP family transporter
MLSRALAIVLAAGLAAVLLAAVLLAAGQQAALGLTLRRGWCAVCGSERQRLPLAGS